MQTLTQADMNELNGYQAQGTAAGASQYWGKLINKGDPYATLALGVVNADTFAGKTARAFAENMGKIEGTHSASIDPAEWNAISADLANRDYTARLALYQNGNAAPELDVTTIRNYHTAAFAPHHLNAEAWTAYVPTTLGNPSDGGQAVWSNIVAHGNPSTLAEYLTSFNSVTAPIFVKGFADPFDGSADALAAHWFQAMLYGPDLTHPSPAAAAFYTGSGGIQPYSAIELDGTAFVGGSQNGEGLSPCTTHPTAFMGYAGDDTLVAGDGNDTLLGGDGNDTLTGGKGDDILIGGNNQYDTSTGSFDTASYSGSTGGIVMQLQDGKQVVTNDGTGGTGGHDTLYGIKGIIASDFADKIVGTEIDNSGNSTVKLSGGLGNDSIAGNAGSDSISGGDGNDLLYAYWNNAKFGNVYNAEAASNNDTVNGDAGADTIVGGIGSDSLSGGADNDLIISSPYGKDDGKIDTLDGGAGNDTIWAGVGDSVASSAGNDYVYINNDTPYTLYTHLQNVAGDGQDTIVAFKSYIEGESHGDGDVFIVNYSDPNADIGLYAEEPSAADRYKIGDITTEGTYHTRPLVQSSSTTQGYGFTMKEGPAFDLYGILYVQPSGLKVVNFYVDDGSNTRVFAGMTNFHNGDLGINILFDGGSPPPGPLESTVSGVALPSFVNQFATDVTVSGGSTGPAITGTSAAETLTGTAYAELMKGLGGADTMDGKGGADTMDGGADQDAMTGGADSDTFKFSSLTDSVHNLADRIIDFSESAGDKIDLSGLGFTTLTTNGTTAAGELRLTYSAPSDRTYIRDNQNTFEVALNGDHTATLTNANFIFGSSAPVNHAPTVANAIADQTANEGQAYAFTVAANTFADSDGDTLTYTATQSSGAALPSWLSFNAATHAFSGTPLASSADLTVRVSVSDGHGGSVNDDYALHVVHPSAGGGTLTGTTGNDNLVAGNASTLIQGLAGADTLTGGAGADTLDGGAGIDVLAGGLGVNLFKFASATDSTETALDKITDFVGAKDAIDLSGLGFTALTANAQTVTGELRLVYTTSDRTYVRSDQSTFEFYVTGDHRTDLTNDSFLFSPATTTSGTTGNDTLPGSAAHNVLLGLAGNDSLTGGAGADTIDGGAGKDVLNGGNGGHDVFKFSDLTQSVGTGSNYDRIVGFAETEDHIDLRGLGFTTITANANTAAGELRLAYSAPTDRTYVRTDQSDFQFYLDGNHATTLHNDNFMFV